MAESGPVNRPMEETKLWEDDLGRIHILHLEQAQFPNQEATGSLIYFMIGTRPDLTFAVGKLARLCE